MYISEGARLSGSGTRRSPGAPRVDCVPRGGGRRSLAEPTRALHRTNERQHESTMHPRIPLSRCGGQGRPTHNYQTLEGAPDGHRARIRPVSPPWAPPVPVPAPSPSGPAAVIHTHEYARTERKRASVCERGTEKEAGYVYLDTTDRPARTQTPWTLVPAFREVADCNEESANSVCGHKRARRPLRGSARRAVTWLLLQQSMRAISSSAPRACVLSRLTRSSRDSAEARANRRHLAPFRRCRNRFYRILFAKDFFNAYNARQRIL